MINDLKVKRTRLNIHLSLLLTMSGFLSDLTKILYQLETLNSSFLVQILYGMGGFVWSFILSCGVLQEYNFIITDVPHFSIHSDQSLKLTLR